MPHTDQMAQDCPNRGHKQTTEQSLSFKVRDQSSSHNSNFSTCKDKTTYINLP